MPEFMSPEIRNQVIQGDLKKLIDHYQIEPATLIEMLRQMEATPKTSDNEPVLESQRSETTDQTNTATSEGPVIPEQVLAHVAATVQHTGTQIEQGVAANQALTELRPLLEKLKLNGLNQEINDWIIWLNEKVPQLETLSVDELEFKIKIWHRVLDYFLLIDPILSLNKHIPTNLQDLFQPITTALIQRQKSTMSMLQRRGITRIDAAPGSRLITGIVEISDLQDRVLTNNPNLHNRVVKIHPGEGGWKSQGKKIVTAYAQVYEYQE